MLPWNSLKKKKDYSLLFKKGKVFVSPPVRLVFFIPDSVNKLFIGIAVSKKRIKKATDRNKIKRQIKESLRPILLEKTFKKTVGFFLFIYEGPENIDFKKLKKTIETAVVATF